jgi:hypothetical protein
VDRARILLVNIKATNSDAPLTPWKLVPTCTIPEKVEQEIPFLALKLNLEKLHLETRRQ